MSRRIPLNVGDVFGHYTVIDDTPMSDSKHRLHYLCRCICGTERYVNAHSLRSGRSQSCGCQRDLETARRATTHGKSKSPEYAVWLQARARCHDPNHRQYGDYGGRGIQMCRRWRESFEAFHADMGDQPFKGATLERKNNHLGYSPKNCVWASRKDQNRNKRNTKKFLFNGQSMVLPDWAEVLGIKKETLVSRIYLYGWSVERAFTTPVNKEKKK